MHGFILTEIEKYVRSKLGDAAWQTLLERAGLGTRRYESVRTYSDAEVVSLVVTASEVTGSPVSAILEDFGCFLGGDLLRIYRPILNPRWKSLDFLENMENTIHRVVRSRSAARPPVLLFERVSADEVLLTYGSPRKLCALAKGIAQGVALHYGETLETTEISCMLRGATNCQLTFKRVA